ncbi:hypothetical protein E2P81_ATG11122 [Venturia nashicola]|nr:hypothetical protein E2P81_ATG11122 [Venturia nashicola]
MSRDCQGLDSYDNSSSLSLSFGSLTPYFFTPVRIIAESKTPSITMSITINAWPPTAYNTTWMHYATNKKAESFIRWSWSWPLDLDLDHDPMEKFSGVNIQQLHDAKSDTWRRTNLPQLPGC